MESPPDPKMLEAALQASQTVELEEFLTHCSRGLADLIGPDSVHAYLRVAGADGLQLSQSWPERKRDARRPPPILDEGWLGKVGRGGRIEELARPQAPVGASGTLPSDGALVFPLGEGKESLGLIVALLASRTVEASRIETARHFLRLVAPALRNVRLVGDLRETAVRDDLAGCYNRRHFETFLGEEIARARRFRSRVSILFLDMDNLKSVNTEFGHAMGSRSLQEVSARITDGIRKIDKLFRFGGDEFCIVLPETDTQGAFEVAERARASIASSPLLVPEVGGVAMSASLGVATFPEHGSTAQELVQAADRAMQDVKKASKNAIGVAPNVPQESTGAPPHPSGPQAASRRRKKDS